MKSIRIFCMLALLFVCTNLRANNIVISNITSVTGSGYVQLQFDISWENSWYNSTNRDAAWVFFKFKDNNGAWAHLNLTNANNSITSGYDLTVPADLTGAMICRNATGSGTVTLTGVRVGVTNLPGSFDIKGFAIEMVRIPVETPYYLGDGSGNSNYYVDGTSASPYFVNSNTIIGGFSSGQLVDPYGVANIPASFPIGFNTGGASMNLYVMKHEITQGAYRDFLNSLTYTQQGRRTYALVTDPTGSQALSPVALAHGNGIVIATPGVLATSTPAVYGCNLNLTGGYNEATDGEWIACQYLSYMDVAAFLDWAAMRPMTEMEYEKACRGPLSPVSDENAGGTAAVANYAYSISNAGATNEVVTTYTGSVLSTNIVYQVTSPSFVPYRTGIHATSNSSRISAGAGYYGVLELSGNVGEITVHTGNAAGRSFTGLSGNGNLNAAGDADVNFWPGINGNNTATTVNTAYLGTTGVSVAAGTIHRGGNANYQLQYTRVSNRGATFSTDVRLYDGGRGVKSF